MALTLEQLGWNESWAMKFREIGGVGLVPARIVSEHRGQYGYLSEVGEGLAHVSGRFRHHAVGRAAFPAVGDWILLEPGMALGAGVIHSVLARRNKLSRKVAGREVEEQLVAANLDTVFLVSSMNRDLNLRKLERFASAVAALNVPFVIVLSKSDLCDDPAGGALEVQRLFPLSPVVPLSAYTGAGLDALVPWLPEGNTVAMLGSSGVGKSTLLNLLLGRERQKTNAVREGDDRGRHATTSREMFRLPGGAWLIDNPGIRELQLWDENSDLDAPFTDILSLAAACRFADCTHQKEPGCAVHSALERGELDPKRWQNFEKLRRELTFMETRHDVHARREQRKKWKKIHRDQKSHYKFRNRD